MSQRSLNQSAKSFIRRLFYRSAACRSLIGALSVLTGRTARLGISHLAAYENEDAIGPVQRDEAVALFGIVKTLRPRTVVEFGFFHGHSAFNFLRALDKEAKLYSYDVEEESLQRARSELSFDRRLTFLHKSQADFDPADVDHRPVDFVFFDAAHELALNIATFQRLLPCLAEHALIAIHDTGLWEKSHFSAAQHRFAEQMKGRWVTPSLYAHQPGERVFVNWILSEYRDFGAIHLHSVHTLRHGLSLLQRQAALP